MKWIRSYYKDIDTTIASANSIVYDPAHCEPYWQENANYRDMFVTADDDIILCEWDIAISREDRALFEQRCTEQPNIIHVAPYRNYVWKDPGTPYSYSHRRDLETFIVEDEPLAMFFGFGLIYLPLQLMKEFLADTGEAGYTAYLPYAVRAFPGKMTELPMHCPKDLVTDSFFSFWHWDKYHERVPVHWDVQTIHLHF